MYDPKSVQQSPRVPTAYVLRRKIEDRARPCFIDALTRRGEELREAQRRPLLTGAEEAELFFIDCVIEDPERYYNSTERGAWNAWQESFELYCRILTMDTVRWVPPRSDVAVVSWVRGAHVMEPVSVQFKQERSAVGAGSVRAIGSNGAVGACGLDVVSRQIQSKPR